MRNLFCFLILAIFSACSKQDDFKSNLDNEDDIKLENSDINGVWILSSDNEYFMSFTEGGSYTFCLNDHLMGSGTYTLKGDTVFLNNSYTNKSDKIEIELLQNNLCVKGEFYLFNTKNKESVNIKLVKSNEEISPSQVGVERGPGMYGLNEYYDITYIGVKYLTDVFAKYEFRGINKKTKIEKVIKSYSWYYVYRKPYTYTQEINGNGTVIRYNFENEWPDEL